MNISYKESSIDSISTGDFLDINGTISQIVEFRTFETFYLTLLDVKTSRLSDLRFNNIGEVKEFLLSNFIKVKITKSENAYLALEKSEVLK